MARGARRTGRLAVGGQAHQLVLAAVDPEAAIIGQGRVEQAERVGEAKLVRQVDRRPAAHPEAGGGPLADAVHGEDRGLVERRGVEGAGGVGLVVLGEDESPLVLPAEGLAHGPGQEEFLADPEGQGLAERPEAGGRIRQIGLEESLELQQGLVVKPHPVEVGRRDPGLGQAVFDGLRREPRVVLLAGEAFFLRGGHDPAVDHQRRGRVVIEGRDAEDGRHDAFGVGGRNSTFGLNIALFAGR